MFCLGLYLKADYYLEDCLKPSRVMLSSASLPHEEDYCILNINKIMIMAPATQNVITLAIKKGITLQNASRLA